MNHVANGAVLNEEEDEEEKEENHLDRILQSNASRRLFTWGDEASSSPFRELTEEMKQEQRLRWNFDFETETPLPGRYQWVRTGPPVNGHHRNGTGEPERKKVCSEEDKQRTTRQAALARELQILCMEKRPSQTDDADRTDSAGSCDTTLNRPPGSGRSLRMNDPSHNVNWD